MSCTREALDLLYSTVRSVHSRIACGGGGATEAGFSSDCRIVATDYFDKACPSTMRDLGMPFDPALLEHGARFRPILVLYGADFVLVLYGRVNPASAHAPCSSNNNPARAVLDFAYTFRDDEPCAVTRSSRDDDDELIFEMELGVHGCRQERLDAILDSLLAKACGSGPHTFQRMEKK
jgi:hypothetical protein